MMYTLLDTGFVRREADGAEIPPSTDNRDYQEYLAWTQTGNTPIVEPEPAPAPIVVYAVQALLTLNDAGLLASVETAVREHPVPDVRIWYGRAQTWEEDNVYVRALAAELNLTDAQLHGLFMAATLK
jgi:hypothetical protein